LFLARGGIKPFGSSSISAIVTTIARRVSLRFRYGLQFSLRLCDDDGFLCDFDMVYYFLCDSSGFSANHTRFAATPTRFSAIPTVSRRILRRGFSAIIATRFLCASDEVSLRYCNNLATYFRLGFSAIVTVIVNISDRIAQLSNLRR